MLPPKYFGLWIEALENTYEDIVGRFVTISGSGELQKLIDLALTDQLEYDIIIVSMVTYRNYIEAYERFGSGIVEMGYQVPPTRFHEAIGAGVQINDEIQEDPGLVFRIDVFSNVAKQIYLSATPYTGNDYVTKMINVMLPEDTDCPLPEYDAYINVIALMYNDPTVQPRDYLTPFKNTFNHARYEKRLLKSKRRLQRYLAMVSRVVHGIYERDRLPGQKLLVLCATVDFINVLAEHLRKEYPALKVGVRVAGSNYQNLLDDDITVSTIKSSGTGVDIPGLRETLLLQFTDSKKDNIQILGRLRKLKDFPGVNPRLTYMVCMDIPQSIRYHASKKGHFNNKVLNHRMMRV